MVGCERGLLFVTVDKAVEPALADHPLWFLSNKRGLPMAIHSPTQNS